MLSSTVFPSLDILVLVCLALIAAQLVYVAFGFGAGLIAVGTLALVLPNVQDVVVMLLLVSLPVEIYVVYQSRKVVQWRGVALICVGIGLGVPLGTWLLKAQEPTFILTVLGGFLLLVGPALLWGSGGRQVRLPAWSAPPVGLLSGLLAGLFGTGGPPLILYFQLGGADKQRFRGNLMAIFLLTALFRLPVYGWSGLISADRVWAALIVFPAVVLGAWGGSRIHLRLSEQNFRRLVAAAIALIGLLLLVTG